MTKKKIPSWTRKKICLNPKCKAENTVKLTDLLDNDNGTVSIRLYCSKCRRAYTLGITHIAMTLEEVDG